MKAKKITSLVSVLALAAGIFMFNPTSASAAWRQDGHGWWNTEGNSYSTGWRNINNSWYYFGSDGYMKTGWANVNGTWYYLNESGAMKTGWINSNNSWYFLNNAGAMQTGWVNDNGTWYYTNENGAMQTGLLTLNNNTYYLNQSGAMVTGDITLNGVKYTFASSGEKVSSVSASDNTNNTEATDDKDTAEDKVTSGGGGGSSSSSNLLSYSDLHGIWKVNSYISNSGLETSLSSDKIDMIVGEKFKISSNEISDYPLSFYTVSNPDVEEKTLSGSEFKEEFGTSLSKLGISGDKVKCITISGDINGNTKTGYIITAGNKDVYAIGKGAAFKLKKA